MAKEKKVGPRNDRAKSWSRTEFDLQRILECLTKDGSPTYLELKRAARDDGFEQSVFTYVYRKAIKAGLMYRGEGERAALVFLGPREDEGEDVVDPSPQPLKRSATQRQPTAHKDVKPKAKTKKKKKRVPPKHKDRVCKECDQMFTTVGPRQTMCSKCIEKGMANVAQGKPVSTPPPPQSTTPVSLSVGLEGGLLVVESHPSHPCKACGVSVIVIGYEPEDEFFCVPCIRLKQEADEAPDAEIEVKWKCTVCTKVIDNPKPGNGPVRCADCITPFETNAKILARSAPEESACAECGQPFKPKNPQHIYCKRKACFDTRKARSRRRDYAAKKGTPQPQEREATKYQPRICIQCEVEFHPVSPRGKLCSEACKTARKAHHDRKSKERDKQRAADRVSRVKAKTDKEARKAAGEVTQGEALEWWRDLARALYDEGVIDKERFALIMFRALALETGVNLLEQER